MCKQLIYLLGIIQLLCIYFCLLAFPEHIRKSSCKQLLLQRMAQFSIFRVHFPQQDRAPGMGSSGSARQLPPVARHLSGDGASGSKRRFRLSFGKAGKATACLRPGKVHPSLSASRDKKAPRNILRLLPAAPGFYWGIDYRAELYKFHPETSWNWVWKRRMLLKPCLRWTQF